MDTVLAIFIAIVLIVIFAVYGCKFATKLELKSQYEKPVPNDLRSATEEEKELLRSNFILVGTIRDGKYATSLIEEWCKSLYVAYGVVIDIRVSTTVNEDLTTTIRYATVKIKNLEFETELKDALVNDNVIVFYSKDKEGKLVYRFTILKR